MGVRFSIFPINYPEILFLPWCDFLANKFILTTNITDLSNTICGYLHLTPVPERGGTSNILHLAKGG
jgi:hypothetical protein